MDLFIGVDMGTSGCRVIAIDAEGTVHARAELPLPAPEAHGPAVEQDPTLWWETCREALGVVLEGLAPGNVQALAVDGTSGTLLLTD
ncbi:MAG: carbohydrate kinase, partial [Gammaproteobacteria bacterium]|nr:carbohydrate kinase [Gammaproteobacteria bacterium]NIT64799.1 carbohydrate kinase [Gammaproteobacteria bacterium]NIY33379.1 carbohydrate kinase [Gammaproteobacteria bacterium]